MQLSAELHLLLLLSHPHARSTFAKQVQQLLSQTIDYVELQRLIEYHRVWNSIALNVLPMKTEFPAQFCSWLFNQQRRCMQQTLLQLHTQQQLSGLLTNAKIPHRFIKGTELAKRLYGDVAWRFSRDIDLLISRQDVVVTEQLIATLGYRPSYTSWLAEDPASRLLLSLQKDNGYQAEQKPVLEVHHRVSNFRDAFSYDASAHLLSLETGLSVLEYLYLCWHALQTNCHRTKWLVDLAVYRSRLDAEIPDWRLVAAPLIKQYRLAGQIDFIDFLLAQTLLMPAPKPPKFWMGWLSKCYVQKWQRAIHGERADMMPILASLLVQQNLQNFLLKTNELMRYPNPEDRQYINQFYPRFGPLLLATLPVRKFARYLIRQLTKKYSVTG